MDEVSSLSSREGMLEFFLDASDELHRYISRLTGGDRQLTEDILQDTFIALLRRQRQGEDSTVTVGWLMVTARHRLIDHVRSRQRDEGRVRRHAVGEQREIPPIDAGSVSAARARWMLAQLPLQERVALALHTLEGMPIVEVAQELNRSVEATTSLLARGRRRLRSLMLEHADER
jgi:RNA polymerase sigma-70 factor (ECF subfamily)